MRSRKGNQDCDALLAMTNNNMRIVDYLEFLNNKQDLTQEQAEDLLGILVGGKVNNSEIAEVLLALAKKGETVDEIVGFAEGMRSLMLTVDTDKDVVDIVGTGGDGSNSFNISTVSAIVTAASGVPVAKHGNRAASSKCGSADVLEALGVNINLNPQKASEVLQKAGMVFLFAPGFHPAMKVVGPVRKELKVRTIFNYLGPFLNPGRVTRMLLGVANLELAWKFLEIAKKMNFKHLIIVTSEDGMDEISVASKTRAFELKNGEVRDFIIDPVELGLGKYDKQELVGGDPIENAEIARNILNGQEKGAKRDAVIINSAFGILVSGQVLDIKEAIQIAKTSIDSGKAQRMLENLIKETNEDA